MSTIVTIVLVILLVILAAGVTFAVMLSRRSKAQLAANLAPAPGLAGGAPAEWAGQHTPEAKMYRRLSELARSLEALPLGDAPAIERKVGLQQQIQEYDRLLIAVAAAPESARRDAVTTLQPKVDAVEAEIGKLATDPLAG